jgi:hypothetical protein
MDTASHFRLGRSLALPILSKKTVTSLIWSLIDRPEVALVEFNRFDVTTKELIWDDPAKYLDRFGVPPRGPVDVIDSDITVLTASADKVIRVGGAQPYLVNVEFQSSHDSGLVETIWFRQSRLRRPAAKDDRPVPGASRRIWFPPR